MKTLHNTTNFSGASNTRKQVRLTLTLIGIVAAMICLYTLRHEARSATPVAAISQRVETSGMASGNILTKITKFPIVLSVWPTK